MKHSWGLDVLRVISMAAVVMLHTSSRYWDSTPPVKSYKWEVLNFFDSSVRWAVPVFVMISGALFLNQNKPLTIRRLYSKNIARILVITLFWGLVYALLYNLPNHLSISELRDFIKIWLSGHYHMWFLFMLIGLYILAPILRCVTKDIQATKYFLFLAFFVNIIFPFVSNTIQLSFLNILFEKLEFKLLLGYVFYYVLGFYLSTKIFSSKKDLH